MELELFAQFKQGNANNQAFFAGMVIGIIFAVILCASIPISYGFKKGQPVLGLVGGVCAGGSAVVLGCLLGLPVALVFVLIIYAVSGNQQPRYKRRNYDDYDDDYDDDEYDRRKRRRKRDDDYDDDEDDRPRRKRDNDF